MEGRGPRLRDYEGTRRRRVVLTAFCFFFFLFFFGVAGFGMIDGFSIRRVRDVFLAKGRIFSGENLSTSFRSILLGSIVFRCARK